jgi:KDO2-lipid IV(A) lauroyltransferase
VIGFTGDIAGFGYATAWRLVRTLPAGTAHAVFRAGADRAFRTNGPSTQQLRRNLSRVVPAAEPAELDDVVRRALRSYARYWCETFRLPVMDLDAVYRTVDAVVTGVEHIDAALAAGNGVVLALPHSGNFDVAGIWCVRNTGPFTTIVQRLEPESLYRRFRAYRESLGFEIIPLTGGDQHPIAVLSARLRANKVVCLVADRDLTAAGVPVTFFAEPARMPGGPALLAARTGATLLPVDTWFVDDGTWGLHIHPPVRIGPGRAGIHAATQALADAFAADIARHPADWHMTQRIWSADFDAPVPTGVGRVPT